MNVPGKALSIFLAAMPLFFAPDAGAASPVAVIPFFNLNEGKAPNLDWIGESVAETLHESLSSSGLLVLAREDREEVYRRLSLRKGVVLTKASVIKIGETLDAGQIIFGDFEVDPTVSEKDLNAGMQISVHVIDLKQLRESLDLVQSGSLQNLSQMETKLAWMLLRAIAPARAGKEEAFYRDRPAVKVEAMESYVRGLLATNPDQKTKLFSQALRIDEHFSQPAFQMGKMQFAKKEYRSANQWLGRVTKSDSHFQEASFLRGICRYYDGDVAGAAEQFRQLATEIPLNEVYNNLGAALSRRNDPAAAENFAKALEGDQTDPDYWFNVGYWLWKQGQFALATEKFRAVLDRSPNDAEATTMLGRCIRMDGPRGSDPKSEGRERIKTSFEDSAWRQLQAELAGK